MENEEKISLAGIVGSLVISLFFLDSGGWRSYLLWFALPVSIVSLTAVFLSVPSTPSQVAKIVEKELAEDREND